MLMTGVTWYYYSQGSTTERNLARLELWKESFLRPQKKLHCGYCKRFQNNYISEHLQATSPHLFFHTPANIYHVQARDVK